LLNVLFGITSLTFWFCSSYHGGGGVMGGYFRSIKFSVLLAFTSLASLFCSMCHVPLLSGLITIQAMWHPAWWDLFPLYTSQRSTVSQAPGSSHVVFLTPFTTHNALSELQWRTLSDLQWWRV